MSDGVTAEAPPETQVRSGWILLFGILEILIGLGAGAMGLLMMVGFLFAERLPGVPLPAGVTRLMAWMALLYGALAVFFLAAGAGTLARRRWARILMLITASLWLALGTLGFVFFLLLLPVIRQGVQAGAPAASGEIQNLVLGLIVGLLGLLYVLLPASFLLFYTRKSVKTAFDRREDHEESASRRPLPVLILCVCLLLGAVGTLGSLFFGVQVIFGAVATGLAALLLTLALASIQGILARGLFRLQARAWWATLIFLLITGISGWMTFQRVPLPALYERMGLGFQRQPGTEEVLAWIQSRLPAYMAARHLLLFSLLLYAKRYYGPQGLAGSPPATGSPPPPNPPSA